MNNKTTDRRLCESMYTKLGTHCNKSTNFKDALEKKLEEAKLPPLRFGLKLDGRWEMSEFHIVQRMIRAMPVLLRLTDPGTYQ